MIGVFYFKVYIPILRDTYTCCFPFDLFLLPIDYTVLIIAFSAASIMLILIKTHTKMICQSNSLLHVLHRNVTLNAFIITTILILNKW